MKWRFIKDLRFEDGFVKGRRKDGTTGSLRRDKDGFIQAVKIEFIAGKSYLAEYPTDEFIAWKERP